MIKYFNVLAWNVPSFQAEKWEYANQKRVDQILGIIINRSFWVAYTKQQNVVVRKHIMYIYININNLGI